MREACTRGDVLPIAPSPHVRRLAIITIMIKNLLFDMGGVVFRQNSEEAYRRFREIGIDPSQYMGDYGQKGFFLDVETGMIGAEEFCRYLAEASGREHISFEEAQYCWLGFVKDVPVQRLHNLLTLRESYHVCLLTNTNPFIMAWTRSENFSTDHLPITHYFDKVFCSYEMRAYKPSPEIFRRAMETDSMLPEETVFIDDSAANVKAAEALGIHGLHVKTDDEWLDDLTKLISRLDQNAQTEYANG